MQLFRGLVSQEYRSLAAVLSIKFYSYFSPKDGQPSDNSNSLFSLCSSVLQDYVDKESRLLDLKTEKLQLTQGNVPVPLSKLDSTDEGLSAHHTAGHGSKGIIKNPIGDMSAIEMSEGILVK